PIHSLALPVRPYSPFKMRCDLHCHSTESDGTEAPGDVVARAQARGVELFALTDHDTCTHVNVPGARTLRAVEISCDHTATGRTTRVRPPAGGGAGGPGLEARLATWREARRNRLRVMAVRLEQRGVRVDIDALLAAAAGRSVGRPDLARAMVASGAA